jgi:hypothetical protein
MKTPRETGVFFCADYVPVVIPQCAIAHRGWSKGPDPESRDSPMCNCTSRFAPCAPRNDRAIKLFSRSYYSSPCTFGISCVGSICGAAGLASTAAGAAACGVACALAGFGCTAADCCAGSGAGLSANGFTSPACGGGGFGVGTGGVRLATLGIGRGGRGTPPIWTGDGNGPAAPSELSPIR